MSDVVIIAVDLPTIGALKFDRLVYVCDNLDNLTLFELFLAVGHGADLIKQTRDARFAEEGITIFV